MLLALDTSGPNCAAALLSDGKIIATRSDDIGRGHAEHLMPMLEEFLRDAQTGWKDLKKIASVSGPGSFTGLRVGLATARGLSLALECPCVGVTVFDAFAHWVYEHEADENLSEDITFTVAMDARRDQLWLQSFKAGASLGEARACPVDDLADFLPQNLTHVLGSGAPLIADKFCELTVIAVNPSPPIEAVAHCASIAKTTKDRPTAFYLRAPDAKPQKPMVISA